MAPVLQKSTSTGCLKRVQAQVGHKVPIKEIRRRWTACQDNLVDTARCFDEIRLFDSARGDLFVPLAQLARGELSQVSPHAAPWADKLVERIIGRPVNRLKLQGDAVVKETEDKPPS